MNPPDITTDNNEAAPIVNNSRRNFLKKLALGTTAAVAATLLPQESHAGVNSRQKTVLEEKLEPHENTILTNNDNIQLLESLTDDELNTINQRADYLNHTSAAAIVGGIASAKFMLAVGRELDGEHAKTDLIIPSIAGIGGTIVGGTLAERITYRTTYTNALLQKRGVKKPITRESIKHEIQLMRNSIAEAQGEIQKIRQLVKADR